MVNISGKHLVQKKGGWGSSQGANIHQDRERQRVFRFCLFPSWWGRGWGERLWKMPLKDHPMLSFVSHQYCTTKSKKFVDATKLRTMIHSFKFEEILFPTASISLILSKLFFPSHYQEESVRKMWWQPLRSFKNFTLDCTRFFLINYLHFQTFKHIQSSNRH